MSDDLYLDEQLLQEIDLRHRAEVAELNMKKAEIALAEAEKELNGLSKLFPFMGKTERANVETANQRLKHWEQKQHDYTNRLEEVEKQLDVAMLAKLREEGAEAYLKGQSMKDFYGLARERIAVFRIRVRDFLKSLGQARGAMTTGYDNKGESYSRTAEDRLEIALSHAHKLDTALADIELLNAEFKTQTAGTAYSNLRMPNFESINYESEVRLTRTLPIARAQMEFEKTLDHCEQLHDEGIDEALNELHKLEQSHDDIMLEIVRKHWRRKQAELLKDSERVEELRARMNVE